MGRTLHELLNIGDATQRGLDGGFVLWREARLSRELFDIIAIGFGVGIRPAEV